MGNVGAVASVEKTESGYDKVRMDSLNKLGLELFRATQRLELKRIESRQSSRTGETYYQLSFDMCVKFDSENVRNNRFLMVPLYCPAELFSTVFKGMKPSQVYNRKFDVTVEMAPNVRSNESGQRFSSFNAEIVSLDFVGEKPVPYVQARVEDVAF